jgi:hypothetical protein
MSEEQFREWANRRSRLPLAVKGHSFILKGDDQVMVDGGRFFYEEALEIVRLLNSRNPISQLNASVLIWERNGFLRIVALSLIALIVVVLFLFAMR